MVIQKSDCYWILAQVCAAPMLRKSEKLVIFSSKQKSLCQLATTELFPKETKNRETERKLQKRVWVLCLRLVVLICLTSVHGSQPLKLKYKTLKISGHFIKFSECQVPLRKCNTPLLKTFWRRFWFEPHIISRDGFVAFDSLQSEKVTNKPIVNLAVQPVGYVLHDVFCSCVWDFYSRGKRSARWSPRCALTSLCRHTYVQCGLFLWAQIRKDRWETYKNVGHVFFQIFQPWRFWWVRLWKLINPVPASQAQFPQFHVIELFASKVATSAVIVGHSRNDIEF